MHSDRSTDLHTEIAARIEPFVRRARHESLEELCRTYLQVLRWPDGIECPRCAERSRLLRLEARSKWHCYGCRYQFSVTAGTLFHRSHLPLWKWLAAVHLMLESPEGISAAELRRHLGGSYKTAWFAAHRIRAAMRGRGEELLRSVVEAELGQPSRFALASHDRFEERATSGAPGPGLRHDDLVAQLGRLIAGPHHHLSAKHLLAYLDEHRWRATHSSNPNAFRDTILALLGGESLPYGQLVAER